MKHNLTNLKTLLETAIRHTNWDLKVFIFQEEDTYGLYVASTENDPFQVVIIQSSRNETVKTLAGDRERESTVFDIYVPQYEGGDSDVGLQGGYYVDLDSDFAWSMKSVGDVAVKVMSWIVQHELDIVIENEMESISYDEEESDLFC